MAVFTARQGLAAGISRGQLRNPRLYRRLLYGVYTDVTVSPRTVDFLAAARLVLPAPVVATGQTALNLHGLSGARAIPLCVATPGRGRRRDIVAIPWRPEHGTGPLASVSVALIDAQLPLAVTVALADAALRQRLITQDELDRLGTVGKLASPRAESPMESRVRVLVALLGLPSPAEQVEIVDEDGRFVARVDFAWPMFRVIVEYEGQQHATDSSQWVRDIARYERLAQLGWNVIRITSADLRRPEELGSRIAEALRRRGYRGGVRSLLPSDLAGLAA